MYAVKEIFYTLQGEGANAGTPAVFCRFAGCNLWSGREADRATAQCQFCDTDFTGTDGHGGGKFASAEDLARACRAACTAVEGPTAFADQVDAGSASGNAAKQSARAPIRGRRMAQSSRLIVLTGGEPMLQVDAALIEALHARGFNIAIETNGTLPVPDGIDWVCVSPKAGTELKQTAGDELKLVFPQAGLAPIAVAHLDFAHFFLQPMDGPDQMANTVQAIDYCKAHPPWRLSVQTHKVLGIA